MRLLVIDTETGGLDPNECSLLTYAGVLWEDGAVLDTVGPVYVKEPVLHLTIEAMRVNRIDLLDPAHEWLPLESATIPLRKFAMKHFRGRETFLPIAAHNADFDVRFFSRLWGMAHNAKPPFDRRAICTMQLLKACVAAGLVDEERLGAKYTLQSAINYFGIKLEDGTTEQRHDCLGDAMLAARLMTRLLKLMRAGAPAEAQDEHPDTPAGLDAAVQQRLGEWKDLGRVGMPARLLPERVS